MLTRALGADTAGQQESFLLLGPRQTGKSTLVWSLIPDLSINLAHEPTYLEFARNPRELEEAWMHYLPAQKSRTSSLMRCNSC
jgi:predicted AAA+ superfamily ATPase